MARVEVVTHVEAPRECVWDILVDWEGQPRWMSDASSVDVVGDRRDGEGTRLVCRTDIAFGLEVDDTLVVTGWRPPASLEVSHQGGLIRGVGMFELTPTEHGTLLVWWEEFAVPLGGVGETFATVLVVPYVRKVFRRSLAGLKRLAEGVAANR